MFTLAKATGLLMTIGLLGGFAVGWANQPIEGQIITVCPQGLPTCQFDKIQEAINAAAEGATIVILPGVYEETESLSLPRSVNLLGYEPRSVLLRTALFIPSSVRASIQALTLVGNIVVDRSTQVTLANMNVVGDIEVAAVAGETEPKARIIMVNVRVSGGRAGPFSYALVVGPAEALVTGSEFLDRLVALNGARVWLYDTQIEVTALNHAGIEAHSGSDLVLQGVKIFSSDGHGVVVVGNARLQVEKSYLISTTGWGMVLAIEACDIKGYSLFETFEGLITGRQNKISGAKELGDVCPSALEFLKTAEGGQYP